MAQSTDLMTAEQLLRLPDDDMRHELIEGVLQTMPLCGGEHGVICANPTSLIWIHVNQHQLGQVYPTDTGFWIQQNPDTVRAPDVAFVDRERIGPYLHEPGYIPLAPDLVGEVVSHNERPGEVENKAQAWLAAGVRVVLVVDPSTQSVRIFRAPDEVPQYQSGRIDLGDVLPGFQLDLAQLFD